MISAGISAIAGQVSGLGATSTAANANGSGFGDLLRSAVGSADGLQTTADSQISSLLQGAPGVDVGTVMSSVEKAGIAFQLMLQVRNKVVSAYQDIEKMQF